MENVDKHLTIESRYVSSVGSSDHIFEPAVTFDLYKNPANLSVNVCQQYSKPHPLPQHIMVTTRS